jgi:transcriptional regulator with XRE-family HTH domain
MNSNDVDLSIPIGTVVRAWREARGLTVTGLAEKAGRPITKGYLSELEHNKTLHPGNVHLTQLARALEIPVRYLINRYFPDEVARTQDTPLEPVANSTPSSTRRRRNGILASPLRAEPPPEQRSVEATTIGQDIDTVLNGENLSPEEYDRLRQCLTTHTRQLTQLMKVSRGAGNEAV